jgi:outer membrane protein assembly factor BamB
MSELRNLLERAERAAGRVELAPDGLERLEHHRDRKRRNERIAAGALALIVAAGAIGGAIALFRGGGTPRPGERTERRAITPDKIGGMRLAWTARFGEGTATTPVVAEDTVFVGSGDNRLYAFPASCGMGRASCQALWVGETEGDPSTPAVGAGVVYVGAGGKLYAFAASCGTEGATCEPLWTAETPGGVSSPAVGQGVVYLAAGDTLYAFPTSCGTGGSTCEPLWTGETDGSIRNSPTVGFKEVYVGTDRSLYAFPVSCSAGTSCEPLWVGRVDGSPVGTAAVAEGTVLVPASLKVYAFPASCGTEGATCEPLWESPHSTATQVTVAAGTVYASGYGKLHAFSVSCGSGGTECKPMWTATAGLKPAGALTADGVVYVPSTGQLQDGVRSAKLIAFSASCGAGGAICEPLRTFTVDLDYATGAAVADGRLFVSAVGGHGSTGPVTLQAFELAPERTPAVSGGARYVYLGIWLLVVGSGTALLTRRLLRWRRSRLSLPAAS